MPAPHRNTGLDALRGLAVLAMIQQHLGAWLTRLRGADGPLRSVLYELNLLGGLAAPLFLVLVGVGLGLEGARARPGTSASLVRRGLALALLAYALNWAVPVWFSPGSFYVLHTIACSWLLGPALLRASLPVLSLLGVALVGAGWVAQSALATPLVLDNARMGDTSLPGGALRLALVEGHFPLLPWLALPVLGLCGARLASQGRGDRLLGLAAALLATGGSLFLLRALGLPLPGLARAARISFYPASTAFLLGAGGVAMGLVSVALTWGEGERAPRSDGLWVALGRTSLTWFVLHVLLFRQLGHLLGAQNFLSAAGSLTVIFFFLIGCALVSGAWARVDYRGSLEWALRGVGPRVTGPLAD